MTSLASSSPAVSDVAPLGAASVILAAKMLAEPLELELPRASAILAATGVGRSRAYELAQKVVDLARTLQRPVGRPRATERSSEPEPARGAEITRAVLRFVMAHPGSVHGHAGRQHYSDSFRRFAVSLRAEHSDVPLETFAACAEVPLGTLKSWLSTIPAEPSPAEEESGDDTEAEATDTEADATGEPERQARSITIAKLDAVLEAYANWHGDFRGFCKHVKRELGIRWGRDAICHVLELHGVRRPRRRPGRSPDEVGLRGAFETFFPGAQWVGDGMTVPVTIDGTTLRLNFELQCDAFSGAFVGISVRDEEDSAAVVESFTDGVATTGAPPLSELLDNKPSNHTEEVDAALGDTLRLRATPMRPQNKAHVEGAFGLFAQDAPPLELELAGATPGQVAAQLLRLMTTTWARARNRRPRADRNGRSRAELYATEPSDEQIAQARAAFEERRRVQELARQTQEARQRPDVRLFLDHAFQRLGLLDPERHMRLAIARYPFDAIIAAVSIFDTKQQTGSLPEGADARYLLGIVKNIQQQRENELLSETLLRLRREFRDITVARLEYERDSLLAEDPLPDEILSQLVDRALLTEGELESHFWLDALVGFVRSAPATEREERYYAAAQYISATFRADPHRRQQAVRVLAERLLPL